MFFFSTRKNSWDAYIKRKTEIRRRNSLWFVWFYNTYLFALFRNLSTFCFMIAVGLLVCKYWHKYIDKCIFVTNNYRIEYYGSSIIYYLKRLYRLILFTIIMPLIFYIGYYSLLSMESLNYNRYKVKKGDHLSLVIIYSFWIYFWYSDNNFHFFFFDVIDFWDHWYFVTIDSFSENKLDYFPKRMDNADAIVLEYWPCLHIFWGVLIYLGTNFKNFFIYSPNVTDSFIDQRRIALVFIFCMFVIAGTVDEKFVGLAKVLENPRFR